MQKLIRKLEEQNANQASKIEEMKTYEAEQDETIKELKHVN